MQAQLKVRNNLIVTVEGDTPIDVFRELAHAQEIFEQEKCGHCGNDKLRFIARQDEDKNEYFELGCTVPGCRAKLPFGLNKKDKGNMYPKRRWDSLSGPEGSKNPERCEQVRRADEKAFADANYGNLPHGGWYKYVPVKK